MIIKPVYVSIGSRNFFTKNKEYVVSDPRAPESERMVINDAGHLDYTDGADFIEWVVVDKGIAGHDWSDTGIVMAIVDVDGDISIGYDDNQNSVFNKLDVIAMAKALGVTSKDLTTN